MNEPYELPMFPLESVLLPSALLPLHVFEPRYRALANDVLAAEREFGVVLIKRGYEVGGGEDRSRIGVVAQILDAGEFPDGRWALECVGTRRISIVEWLPDDPYPLARVFDHPDAAPTAAEIAAFPAIVRRLRNVLAKASEAGDSVAPATITLADDPVLASYQVAAVAPLSTVDRYEVLVAVNLSERLAILDRQLASCAALLDIRLGETSLED